VNDVIIQMSMSLDGYIAGPNDSDVNGLGDGGEGLHDWLFAGGGTAGEGLSGADQDVIEDLRNRTGAMITGRRLYDITHGWQGTHDFGAIPAFVVSKDVPDEVPSGATPFTFVHDGIASVVAQAKKAAGDKDVYVIGGADIIRQLLDAGLADELRIDLIPLLLGGGIRLFDNLGKKPISLEQVRSTASGTVTHVRYRVLP
jgi:dihydrofolate reductase